MMAFLKRCRVFVQSGFRLAPALLLSLAAAALADDPLLPGWTVQTAPNGDTTYTAPGNSAIIAVGDASTNPNPDDALLLNVARGIESSGGCKGLTQQPITNLPSGNGRQIEMPKGGAMGCTLVITGNGTKRRFFIMLEEPPLASNQVLSRKIVARDAGGPPPPVRQSRAPAPAQASPASAAPAGDAGLIAAIRSVPAANRPMGMIMRNAAQMSGGFVYYTYKPWMIFANGYATDWTCYDWDPRILAPTPAALSGPPHKCDVVRWRKVGTRYQFQEDDGSWDTEGTGAKLNGFAPGTRLDRNLINKGGNGSVPVTGMVQVNTVYSGQLRMTNSGQIRADWKSATVVGGGGVGGGANAGGTALLGQYYLDGHLIAVRLPDGTIRVAFIGGSNDEGEPPNTHIYLNGTQYWPIRD